MKSGKTRLVLPLLLSFLFLLSACAAPVGSIVESANHRKIELTSFEYYNENNAYVIEAPVYKPWRQQYGALHNNPKAPESFTFTMNGTPHTGEYIGWSTTFFPYTQITDYYCGLSTDGVHEYFRINSRTGELLYYTRDQEPETKENIGGNWIQEIADDYAAQFLHPDEYEVQLSYNSVFNTYTVDYTRPQVGEFDLPDSLRLRLEGNGEIRYVENRILKPIQKWCRETTQAEREALIQSCNTTDITQKIKEEAEKRIAPLIKEPYYCKNIVIHDIAVTATKDGKPALCFSALANAFLREGTVQDGEKPTSCHSFRFCFLVYAD